MIETVNIPGIEGDPGAAGAAGGNAYTITTADITLPGGPGPVIGVSSFASTAWMVVTQVIIIATDDTHSATFRVTAIPTASTAQLEWLAYPDDVGALIPSGSSASPSGQLAFTAPLPVASGGTGGTSLATNLLGLPTAIIVNEATLVTGVITLAENITASSKILVSLKTPGGTRTGFASYKLTAITPGTPGSFVITAINDSAATLAACTDIVTYLILN